MYSVVLRSRLLLLFEGGGVYWLPLDVRRGRTAPTSVWAVRYYTGNIYSSVGGAATLSRVLLVWVREALSVALTETCGAGTTCGAQVLLLLAAAGLLLL